MLHECGWGSQLSLGTKRVACSLGNRRCTGRTFAWAAAKSSSSKGDRRQVRALSHYPVVRPPDSAW